MIDSLIVVNIFQSSKTDNLYRMSLLQEVISLMGHGEWSCEINHDYHREVDQCVDKRANLNLSEYFSVIVVLTPPPNLLLFLDDNCIRVSFPCFVF